MIASGMPGKYFIHKDRKRPVSVKGILRYSSELSGEIVLRLLVYKNIFKDTIHGETGMERIDAIRRRILSIRKMHCR